MTLRLGMVTLDSPDPEPLAQWWADQTGARIVETNGGEYVVVKGGAQPDIEMLDIRQRLPLAGHTAYRSMPAIYDLIRKHKTTLVFVNTRLQAEYTFKELWDINEDGLAIALHHGSLDVAQRRRVEEAMAAGRLRAVVCTATLDLGIDWGDVDLVVNVGAPKGASRIMQRIGRSNHRMDEPSKAYLVPANRFEILECRAALDAVHEAAQDTPDARIGALDGAARGLDRGARQILGLAVEDREGRGLAIAARDGDHFVPMTGYWQQRRWTSFRVPIQNEPHAGAALRPLGN